MFMNTYNSHHSQIGFKESSLDKINERIERRFPFITDLLNKFNGHLIACDKESRGTPNWNLWF